MEVTKTMVNVLIVTAIILIGVSVTSVLMKKSNENTNIAQVPTETIKQPATEESTSVSTTTEGTTTEIVATTTSTTTSTSSTIDNVTFTNKKWTWVKTTLSGTSTTPKKSEAFSVTFNATGTITGTTDCNKYFGSYKSTSTKLTLGPLGATKMFCEGSQENDFMNVLQKVTGYSIDKDNNLILSTASGTMIFR